NGGTYQAYTWKGFNVDTEPTVIDYDFTMKEETDIMTKFCFNCGNQEKDGELGAHTIYLDNVTLELVDDSKVDYGSVGPYQAPILTNQIGFRPNDKKTAVIRKDGGDSFKVINADTKEVAMTGTLGAAVQNSSADESDRIADFSEVTKEGKYYITCGDLDQSYTFVIAEKPYEKLMDESIRMFYLQRCGCEVKDNDFGHKACHAEQATIYQTNEKIDVSGGWHDAGDYGRYVVAGAKAVADLLYAYLANPSMFGDKVGIPESGNGTPDILDETRYELEWMLKMQAASGGVYHKVTCESFPGYVAPTAETKPLIVTPISSTATADFCASMALASEVYAKVDETFAKKCMAAAEKAWSYLQQNPQFNFKNPADISTGEYGDKTDKDERYWAACQMYRATGDAKYLEGVSAASTGLDWSTVGDYGNIALLTMKNADKTFGEKAKNALVSAASTAEKLVNASPYSSPISKYDWGSNMTIANAGIVLALDGKQDAANEVLNHLLGKNPNGVCYVTGFGTVSPENPHHRPSMVAGKAQPGMLVGGVNSQLEDSAAKAYCKSSPAAKCYIDNAESYSTNEITIYWNSPLIYLLALTEKAQSTQPQESTETTTTTTTTET
ncbi:MAG: glycoside hydrolase family 9 protein, partial [Oscillospiraceae bacterium]|nr:glycoside hydrolase family 9 protein [Oscillospiraceae bacterium]